MYPQFFLRRGKRRHFVIRLRPGGNENMSVQIGGTQMGRLLWGNAVSGYFSGKWKLVVGESPRSLRRGPQLRLLAIVVKHPELGISCHQIGTWSVVIREAPSCNR